MFKFLDAQKTLSVQVHPNDDQAARLDPPDLGKTEAWVVLAAEPGSRIYAGLKRGFDRHALEREVHRGTCELCLHSFEPQPGDCVFIPAGTVHALGAGLVVAEIQQASDTTFRLFDWNRVDRDGKPRPLHIRESLDTINYLRGQVQPQTPAATEATEPGTATGPAEPSAPALKAGPGVDVATKTVRLGVLNDESGPAATIGKPYAAGKRFVAAIVNAGGSGLLPEGWKVELVEKDHGYNPQKSVQAYNEIKDNVLFFAQSFGTPNTMPLRPVPTWQISVRGSTPSTAGCRR